MPPQPHAVLTLPSEFDLLVRILLYAAGTALSAFGGFHGYRGYRRFRGIPFSDQQAEAERLRDDFVFGDDLAKMYDEDPSRLDGDDAYKEALAGDVEAEEVMKRRVVAAAKTPPGE